MSWRTAVAAAALVLGVTLASGPLYRSSIATAALQREVADVCPVDVGLSIAALPAPGPRLDFERTSLDGLAKAVPSTDAPITVEQTSPSSMSVVGHAEASTTPAVVLHRDGQEQIVTPLVRPLTGHDALVPSAWATLTGVAVGDALSFGAGVPVLRVAGLYDDFDADSPANPWCGQRTLFAAGPFGDPAAPVVLTAADVIDELHAAGVAVTSTWELPVRSGALHEDNARRVIDGMARIPEEWQDLSNDELMRYFLRVHPGTLDSLDRRADSVSRVIVRTVTPVQLAACAACLAMLVASGALLARRRRTELQLLVERGSDVPLVAGRVAVSIVLPVVCGTAAGFAAAWAGVTVLAPSPTIAMSALVVSAVLAVAGAAAAVLVVTIAASATTYRAVDPVPRRRWTFLIPWEIAPLAVAVASWLRVHHDGGVHLSGIDVKGGDALAQAFPVLAVIAMISAIARVTYVLACRHRTVGGRLPLSIRLGLRRVVGDVPATVLVVLAGTLAISTFSVAALLRDTAGAAARRKADTFVGADMAIDVAGDHVVPDGLADRATLVARAGGEAGRTAVDVLAIDPATFARAATWAGDRSQHEALLARLQGPVASIPAIVAGGQLPTTHLDLDRAEITVAPIGTVDSFPGLHSGAVLVVVDARALPPDVRAGSRQVWVHSPPANVAAQLHSAGFPIYGTSTSGRVFDAVSFLVVEWSFAGMQAFGLVIGSLVVLVQALVVAARHRQREVAWIVTRRMGLSRGAHRIAIVVELAVPATVAVIAGVAVASFAARLSVGPLDPRPELLPSSTLVVDATLFTSVAIAIATAVIVMTLAATASLRRANAMEIIRAEP